MPECSGVVSTMLTLSQTPSMAGNMQEGKLNPWGALKLELGCGALGVGVQKARSKIRPGLSGDTCSASGICASTSESRSSFLCASLSTNLSQIHGKFSSKLYKCFFESC